MGIVQAKVSSRGRSEGGIIIASRPTLTNVNDFRAVLIERPGEQHAALDVGAATQLAVSMLR
jgi:hypothetical protein